ncbi:hypothetical protein K5X82_02800 [Halosquirtibacter xylanolyticus]|uniref:hypothetical protein n=1 Tax=Halosquirtibacter xylanolyticus TaxID=3374599 RepID=UPI003748C2BE|nr:hypothetical protein K5X82_02800 [Prolixibacteraceae bacterium]
MQKRLSILLSLFITSTLLSFGQKQGLGGFSPKTDWEKINTRSINVIYPAGYDSVANRVVNLTNFMHDYKLQSIGSKNSNRKLQILLAPNDLSNSSNVQLGPYMGLIPTTGPQNILNTGGVDWVTQSSIFAYRRALQYSNFNSGIFRIFYWLNGDNGVDILSHTTTPAWFFLGDAAYTQTVLTNGGIGYTPSFYRQQRARILAGKNYSYLQIRNGSYLNVMETPTVYGLSMIEHAREMTGPDVWKDVVKSAARLHGVVYSFSNSVRTNIGCGTSKLYKLTYDSLSQRIANQQSRITLTNKIGFTKTNKRFYEHYSSLQLDEKGQLYALKKPIQKLNRIVQIAPNGKEKSVVLIPTDHCDFFSIKNGWIVWNERRDNPMHKHLDYSVIFTYNLYTKQTRQLTHNSKYFSPSLSKDGFNIATIEKMANFNRSLTILDRKTGDKLESFPIYRGGEAFNPQWSNDSKYIIYILQVDSKIQLVAQDIVKKKIIEITPLSNQMISNFSISPNNTIVFSASYSGIDNIYKTNLYHHDKITQVTSSKVGAYDPVFDQNNNSIYYCDYTHLGAKVTAISKENFFNKEVNIKPLKNNLLNQFTVNKQEKDITCFDFNQKNHKSKYREFWDGIKIHSWGFLYLQNGYGFGIKADDILSNISGEVGYSFDNKNNQGRFYGSLTYGKYPIKGRVGSSIISGEGLSIYKDSIKHVNTYAEVFIPLKWKGRLTENDFDLRASIHHHNFTYEGVNDPFTNEEVLKNADFNALTISSNFKKTREKKRMNLQPKWGIEALAQFQINLNRRNMQQLNLQAKLYIPGFFANDGFNATFSYQQAHYDIFDRFDKIFNDARGYYRINRLDMMMMIPNNMMNITADNLFDKNYTYIGSYNYQIPICYPDFGLGGILFFQRIYANAFFDIQQIRSKPFKEHLYSYGFGLNFDLKIFNDYPVHIGISKGFLSNPIYSAYNGDDSPIMISYKLLNL